MNTSTTTRGNGVRDDDHAMSADNTAQVLKDMFSGTFQHLDELWATMTKIERSARKHPVALLATGSAVILAVASGITVGVLENRRRSTFAYKLSKSMKWAKDLF
jgi:hypothetical protein